MAEYQSGERSGKQMRAIGTGNTWFEFKTIRNDDLDVRMLSMPTRPHPARKGTVKSIPGRNGKLFQDEGAYDRIVIPIRVITGDNANIDEVNAWLSGEGDLRFGDEPDRVYHAHITKEFSRSNRNPRLRGQEFTVSFDCEPFRYQANPDAPIALPGNGFITPKGTVASAPMIKIANGNDYAVNFEFGIGRYSLTVNVAGNTTMCIDCDAKIAFTGDGTTENPYLLATHNVFGDDWISIEPGEPNTAYHNAGDNVSITVEPRWRWL